MYSPPCYATHESWATLHILLPEFKEIFIMPHELYSHPLRNIMQHITFFINLDKEKPFRQTHAGAQTAQSQQMQVKSLGLYQSEACLKRYVCVCVCVNAMQF